MTRRRIYTRFDEVDWSRWSPVQRATLCFVVRDGRILLIHKKRGIGAGKINGPGGRIADGESPRECAIREVREEVCVTPTGVLESGWLCFQFADGFSIDCRVFRASGIVGEPRETDEAVPLWVGVDEIPYERMWEDDRLWMPFLLEGRRFAGRVLFDGDAMLGHEIEVAPRGAGAGAEP